MDTSCWNYHSNPCIVVLSITSYIGVSGGAEHHYGRLEGTNVDGSPNTISLEYSLNARQAAALRRKDGSFLGYLVGDLSERFWSERDVIEFASKNWKKHFPKGKILILGRGCIIEPQKVLIGPPALKKEVNELYDRALRCNFWDNEGEMQKVCDRWDHIMKTYWKRCERELLRQS